MQRHSFIFGRICRFVRQNTVLGISVAAAVLTSCFVPPDAVYISYFDFKTLTCLFCMLAIVCALRNIQFFTVLAQKIVNRFHTARTCVLALVYITFIGSMMITNDMALLTFLPLSYYVLSSAGKQKYIAFTFIIQDIAANLGGMLTPFGNPQNLYLYAKFNIPDAEFIAIMLPTFLFSVAIITICCLFVKPEKIHMKGETQSLPVGKIVTYFLLFSFSVAIVFRIIPYYWGLFLVPATLFFMDRQALKSVDYPLLFTFAAFFVFAGNMARIEIVRQFFASFLEGNTLLFGALSSQFISNVPAAILLSQFTDNYPDLLVGVNIGGVGTLIASLAGLITYREYVKYNSGKARYFILLFSLYNFAFLLLLYAFASIF